MEGKIWRPAVQGITLAWYADGYRTALTCWPPKSSAPGIIGAEKIMQTVKYHRGAGQHSLNLALTLSIPS